MVEPINYPKFVQDDLGSIATLEDDAVAAIRDKYATFDRTFESVDVAKNPSKYTAEQKLVYYLDLLQAKTDYSAYQDYVWLDRNSPAYGAPDPIDKTKVLKEIGYIIRTDGEISRDLEKAIGILQADPDVQAFLSTSVMSEIQTILTNGGDANLLGNLQSHYIWNVVDGNMLESELADGKTLDQVITDYTTALSFYKQVLPSDVLNSTLDTANAVYAQFLSDQLLGGTPVDDFTNFMDTLTGTSAPNAGDTEAPTGAFLKGLPDESTLANLAGSNDPGAIDAVFGKTIEAMATLYSNGAPDSVALHDRLKSDLTNLLNDVWGKLSSGELDYGSVFDYLSTKAAELVPNATKAEVPQNGSQLTTESVLPAKVASELTSPAEDVVTSTPVANPDNYLSALLNGAMALVEGGGIAATAKRNSLQANNQPQTGIDSDAASPPLTGDDIAAIVAQGTKAAAEDLSKSKLWTDHATSNYHMFGSDGTWTTLGTYGFGSELDKLFNHNQSLSYQADETVKSTIARFYPAALDATTSPTNTEPAPIAELDPATQSKIDAVLGPTLSIMAENLFPSDITAQNKYKVNVMSVVTALWGMTKPGGDFSVNAEYVKKVLGPDYAAPPGTSLDKYQKALVDGASALLNGVVVAYRMTNNMNATPDAIAATVTYGTQIAGGILRGTGKFLSDTSVIDALIGPNGKWANSLKLQYSIEALKNAGSAIGLATGLAWAGLDWYWAATSFKSGDIPGGVMISIASVADTIGAVSSGFAVIEQLANSLLMGVNVAAESGSIASSMSTVFGVASLVSNVAWLAITAYNDIKQDKEFDKVTERMSNETERLVDDSVEFISGRFPWEANENQDLTPW
jgi:hypothetical protein